MNMTYVEKLKDPRWLSLRQVVLQRDRYKCRECGATNGLQVHHCFYEGGDPWDTPERFLMSLCGFHHGQRQEREKQVIQCLSSVLTLMSAEDLRRVAAYASEGGLEAAENVMADVAMHIARVNFEGRERLAS